MKFSEVIMATASIVLIGILLDALLKVVFIPLNSNSLSEELSYIIAFLVVSLVVGYIFALKIQEESRIRAISGIVVLSSLALMLFLMAWYANPLVNPWFKDSLDSMFNTSGWTNYDWSAYSSLALTVVVLIGLVVDFIGLYAGSMLRKPKKAQENHSSAMS